MNGPGNNGIYEKVQLVLYKDTHMSDLHFPVISAPHAQTLSHTTSYTYMTWIGSHLGNTPNLRRISPIGHPVTFFKPNLLDCITYLRIFLGKGGFDAHFWVI
jgi:hypothetical protein